MKRVMIMATAAAVVVASSRPRPPMTARIVSRLSTATGAFSPNVPTTTTTTTKKATSTDNNNTTTTTVPDVPSANSTGPSSTMLLQDAPTIITTTATFIPDAATTTTTTASSISSPDSPNNKSTGSSASPNCDTTNAPATADSSCISSAVVPTTDPAADPDATALAGENADTVRALRQLGVRVSRVRRLHGWVLRERAAHVRETAALLASLGVRPAGAVAALLERCPRAVLCPPADARAQSRLWLSLCDRRDGTGTGGGDDDGGGGGLANVVQRFPETFFLTASPEQRANQQDNIALLLSEGVRRRVLARLLAAAPQLFVRPAADNRASLAALRRCHRSLGGAERDLPTWLVKLLSQDAHALAGGAPERLAALAELLRRRLALSDAELLRVATGVRGASPEPAAVEAVMRFCRDELRCDGDDEEEGYVGDAGDAAVKRVLLACPTLLSFPAEVLAENLKVLLSLGVALREVRSCPGALELTAAIVRHRAARLRAAGLDVARGALPLVAGTRRQFEDRLAARGHARERPLFNPVAPPPPEHTGD